MRQYLVLLALVLTAALFPPREARANDECSEAFPVVTGTNGPYFMGGSTLSAPAWPCSSTVNRDVWFRWVSTCNGIAQVTACDLNGTFFPRVEVFSGSCGALQSLACNGDLQCTTARPWVVRGETYSIRVGSSPERASAFQLTIDCQASGSNPNDDCVQSLEVYEGLNGPFTNAYAGVESIPWPCGSSVGADVWFRWTAPRPGPWTVDTCTGSDFDTVLEVVRTGCSPQSTTSLGCNDNSPACGVASIVTFSASYRQTYVIRVGGQGGATGVFKLRIRFGPADDECHGATPIQDGANGPFRLVPWYFRSSPAFPCGSAQEDRWFLYVPDRSRPVTFDTCGSTIDSVLEVFDGSAGCNALQSLGCDDDGCGLQSSLTLQLNAGTPYFVRVGATDFFDSFHLNVTEWPRRTTIQLGNSAVRFGLPLEALGDYDADGYQDFAVSDLEYGPNNGGTVWIVSGKTLTVLDSFEGSLPFERFGQDMAGVDGKLIVSGPDRNSGLGPEGEIVELFYNSSGGLSRRLLLRGRDLGLNGIGRRLAVSNYLNGDGARDLVFMAPDPVSGANTLIVACSANAGSPYREHWRYSAPFGVGVIEFVGDMNGDGHDDVALGMASYNNGMGRVEILSGRDGSLLNARNGNPQSQFGFAIQGLGDLDGDGRAEIAVSAPDELGGWVRTMSLDMQTRWQRYRSAAGDRFGFALSSTGDGDGDGVHDLLISRFPTTSELGAVELISGATGSIIRTVTGTTSDFGRAVLSVDVTGNGQVEDIVMEPLIGAVHVYLTPPVNGPVSRTDFGPICAGSQGNLARSTVAMPPRIGGSLVWKLTAAPPTTIGVLQLGFQGIHFPLDGLGAPGCVAQVLSFISAQTPTDAHGTAAFAASIPNDPLFIGGSMLAQWIVLDLAANSLGITTTNASSFVIGG